MDFTGLLVLAALWLLVNLMSRGRQPRKPPTQARRPPAQRVPRPEVQRRVQLPAGLDSTQREGSRLERVLREFERALEEAGSPVPTSLPPPPQQEEWEERESLEREPEVVSLETEVHREARRLVDQDDEAEQIVARRISAAAARDKAVSKREHLEFDARIRQEAADKTATPGFTPQQLRDAVVWREILGPPVSLRDEVSGER